MNACERENGAETSFAAAREAFDRQRFDVAQEHLMQAVLALSELPSPGDVRGLRVAIFFALGNTYLRLGACTDAVLAYGVATAAAKAMGDRMRAMRIDLWIGEAHRRAGKDIDAEIRWRELVRVASEAGAVADELRKEALRRLGGHLESRGRTFEATRIRKLVGVTRTRPEPSFE